MDGEQKAHRRGLPRAVRNAIISVVGLLVLLVGAGVAYIYYSGSDTVQPASTAVAAETAAPAIKATPPSPKAQESAAVQFISSPVKRGSSASISVKTLATSVCKIKAVYDKVASTDPGLASKKADDFGSVEWSWTVGRSVPAGTWPVTVTCTYHGRSAVVTADLQVT